MFRCQLLVFCISLQKYIFAVTYSNLLFSDCGCIFMPRCVLEACQHYNAIQYITSIPYSCLIWVIIFTNFWLVKKHRQRRLDMVLSHIVTKRYTGLIILQTRLWFFLHPHVTCWAKMCKFSMFWTCSNLYQQFCHCYMTVPHMSSNYVSHLLVFFYLMQLIWFLLGFRCK